tara:strand:- start:340 stop:540 length:201 start_codon:yes stop_codon:yes gene_type:complete
MTKQYTITIRNLYENKSKQITLDGDSAMLAHKEAYMNLRPDEEISQIIDSEDTVVFDLQKGFNPVI